MKSQFSAFLSLIFGYLVRLLLTYSCMALKPE
jgi:hypothetical protein